MMVVGVGGSEAERMRRRDSEGVGCVAACVALPSHTRLSLDTNKTAEGTSERRKPRGWTAKQSSLQLQLL